MTTHFVHHSGDGSSPTTDPGVSGDWSGAYSTITAATSAMANGDTIKVSNQHVGSTASSTFQNRGTNTTPAFVVGVDHNDTSIEATGAAETYSNHLFIYGAYSIRKVHLKTSSLYEIRFISTGFNFFYLEDCIFELTGSSSARIVLSQSPNAGRALFKDCKFRFANAGQQMKFGNNSWIEFVGGAVADTGTVPSPGTGVFFLDTGCFVIVRSMDLSNISGKLVGTAGFNPQHIYFSGCKFHPSVDDFDVSANGNQGSYHVRHDADGYFKETSFGATSTRDLTVVKNAGVGFSRAVTTVVAIPILISHQAVTLDLTSGKTLTLELAQYDAGGAPAALTADEFQVIIEYPDGTALWQTAESTAISSSSQRWDDDLGAEITTNITKQKVSINIPSTGASGTANVLLRIAKDAITVNIDPSISVV